MTNPGAQRAQGAPADEGGIVRLFKGKNPLGFLFGSSRRERSLARYVLREHGRGRPLAEILDARIRPQ